MYRYTLHPLNGSRTHTRGFYFPLWLWLLPIARRARCSSKTAETVASSWSTLPPPPNRPDDGPEGSSISFYYVSVVGRVALSWFVLFRRSPVPNLAAADGTPPLSLLRTPTPHFGGPIFIRRRIFIFLAVFFSLVWESLRSLSQYLLGGPTEDERLDVETKWTIVQLFALGGASASHPTRAV